MAVNCTAFCFGSGFIGSPSHDACLAACHALGGIDPPLPVAFDNPNCCSPDGLNLGWDSIAYPGLAVEYQ
jgi:hypothetical protein